MKAWILEKQARIEERPLRLVEISAPQPKNGEVRVRVLICGVCRTDIHIADGDLPLRKSPVVLGHEIVGVVDEVGRDVKRFQGGERVGVYWLHSTCKHCKYCLSHRENYCPQIKCTGWDVDGGYAEYVTIPAEQAVPLEHVPLAPAEIAALMCPGVAGYAAFKLTGARAMDRLGLYGFGPTAECVLKIARSMGIQTYVSTRSAKNIEAAKRAGADWAADTRVESMPYTLDAAILFPPAGDLVEPVLLQLERGGVLVMAPVSASPILIDRYSDSLWGRDIRTLYNLKKSDADEFFAVLGKLGLRLGVRLFPFEDLQDALIMAKLGRLKESNAVIRIAEPSSEDC